MNSLETVRTDIQPEVQMDTVPKPLPLQITREQSSVPKKSSGAPTRSKVLRFARSERLVHWCFGVPFLVSFTSALILVAVYNPDPTRPYRSLFVGIHRASGMALAFLPMLAILKCRGDFRIYFYNIRQAWTWAFEDFKWLALMGLAVINSKIKLPEQGKFNAGQKMNFMVAMTGYPLYILTGSLMCITHATVLAWILHFMMAMVATPLLCIHLFMALINRDTRPALEGMLSGFVDRQWAKHHHRRWYREHHEASEEQRPEDESEGFAPPPPHQELTCQCASLIDIRGRKVGSPVVDGRLVVRTARLEGSIDPRLVRVKGEVALSVVFEASGRVRVLGVEDGLGHGLEEAAQQAAKQIKFKPALQGEQPVDFPATVRIVFESAA